MKHIYSIYEAKAQFSELVRQVREHGISVTISYHGKPVAELRPVGPAPADPMELRLRELIERGEVIPARSPGGLQLKPIAKRPGALQRFLEARD